MQVIVSPSCESSIVTVIHPGPQGPPGPTGGQAGSGLIVDDAAKIDKSVVYYDAATASYKANAIWTISTIVDGANF
jgi:hypothetical protein